MTAPVIVTDGVQVTSTPNAPYGLSEITVTFDNAVTVDTSGGTIQFRLGPPRTDAWAEYRAVRGARPWSSPVQAPTTHLASGGLPCSRARSATHNTVDATLTYLEPGTQSGHR